MVEFSWPRQGDLQEYKALLGLRHPGLPGTWGPRLAAQGQPEVGAQRGAFAVWIPFCPDGILAE